ncbi:MAG: TonB-dependent receptor [Bacteroidota bacterium]
MKILIFFGCLVGICLAPIALMAQQQINGKVVDAITGDILFGANVYLKSDWKTGTSSGEDGTFSLTVLDLDDSLIISYLGYKEQVTAIAQKRITIRLEPLNQKLSELVVKEEKLIAEEFTIQKIRRLEIYKNPSAKADALLAVNTLPSSTTTDESANVSFRGSSTRQTGIFLNNVPVYNAVRFSQLNGIGTFSIFNTEILESVQVFPGNPPLEFGSTTSGLIAVQTSESFYKKPTQSVTLSLASFGFNLKQPLGNKTAVSVFTNYQPSQLIRGLNRQSLENILKFDSFDAGVHFVHKPTKNSTIKLFNYTLFEGYSFQMNEPTFDGTLDQNRNLNLTILNYRLQFNRWNLSVNQGFNASKIEVDFSQFDFDIWNKDYYASFNAHYESPKFGLKTGLTYDLRSTDFEGLTPGFSFAIGPDHPAESLQSMDKLDILDAYLYLKYYLNDKVTAGIATRKNIPLNNQPTYLSGQGNINIKLNSENTINLGVGRFNQLSNSEQGNGALLTTSTQYGVDYLHGGDRKEFTLSLFAKTTDIGSRNIQTMGIETFFRYKILEKLNAQVSYAFLDSEERRDELTFDANFDLDYFFKGGIEYNINSLFTISSRFIFREGTLFSGLENAAFRDDLNVSEPSFAPLNERMRYRAYRAVDLNLSKLFPVNEGLTIVAFASMSNVFNFKNVRSLSYNFDYTASQENFFNLRTSYFGAVLNFH